MDATTKQVSTILDTALARISCIDTIHELDQLKSLYLGKAGTLTSMLKQLKDCEPAQRSQMGQVINRVKERLLQSLGERHQFIKQQELVKQLNQEAVDVTLPVRDDLLGALHPLTKVRYLLEDFFIGLGFSVVSGPEIETDFYNFTALNIPKFHPARTEHDTFYLTDELMLRSQTSTVQIRTMEDLTPPLRIISPGRVFRRDSDATHSPMFHQLEMLAVDRGLTFANLKWLVVSFIQYFFHDKVEYRFRPSYFPFTEPSAEVDIKWKIGDTWRWLELGGCGMVHPNVLEAVKINPEHFSGLAFGFGIDRLAMSYYGIDDIRRLFDNDYQFLRQFSTY